MPASFHDEPFDEGTLTKLELFERYAEAWLPVFVARHELIWHDVNIYDFFAGAGTDGTGVEGSPLRLLRVIEGQRLHLARPGLKVSLHLSDAHDGKMKQLKQTLGERNATSLPINLDVQRAEFASRFEAAKSEISKKTSANLLIIDQFGVKEVPDEVFMQILGFETTDVLFLRFFKRKSGSLAAAEVSQGRDREPLFWLSRCENHSFVSASFSTCC